MTAPSSLPKPCCYDCLSEDVAVKVIDPLGFEHWFCARDWAAQQALHDRLMDMITCDLDEIRKGGKP